MPSILILYGLRLSPTSHPRTLAVVGSLIQDAHQALALRPATLSESLALTQADDHGSLTFSRHLGRGSGLRSRLLWRLHGGWLRGVSAGDGGGGGGEASWRIYQRLGWRQQRRGFMVDLQEMVVEATDERSPSSGLGRGVWVVKASGTSSLWSMLGVLNPFQVHFLL
ncbi:hypothetical protein TIFTF001_033348 [Ficus carica]|uniref:Uncharacterized protein n=1 Tax=Ficus carica TaxID=3494 RepID=A0AA88DZ27_FICCA|nr:hypothetical protein TIFTF001_033348 [Ficus carica]